MEDKLDRWYTPCSNTACASRLACERGSVYDKGSANEGVAFQKNEDGSCDWFMIRKKLQDEGSTLRRKVTGGRRHNLHAAGSGYVKRPTPESLGLKEPDLMVKRHIRKGIDLKKED